MNVKLDLADAIKLIPCPVIGAFLRSWNDSLGHEDRNELLRPLILQLVGTKGTPALEQKRATMATDWLIRVHTPAWLRLAGLSEHADTLAALPEITEFSKCPSLMPALQAAQRDASAARDAARAAATVVAWDAARAAAGAAVRVAAWAAAWDVAWDAARAAARGAARAAAEAAAGAAAWDAVRVAAWAAAWDVAWDAARAALTPTRIELQQSALALVLRMIEA